MNEELRLAIGIVLEFLHQVDAREKERVLDIMDYADVAWQADMETLRYWWKEVTR